MYTKTKKWLKETLKAVLCNLSCPLTLKVCSP